MGKLRTWKEHIKNVKNVFFFVKGNMKHKRMFGGGDGGGGLGLGGMESHTK